MTFKKRLIFGTLITAGLLLSGCMYSFKGSLPPHIRSIAIPLFENQTAEYQINETITDLLTQQFLEENVLRVEDEETADSILEGTVTSISDSPYTYDEAEQVQDYRVSISLKVTWYDVEQDKVRLDQTVSGWGVYDAQQAATTRQDGIREAIDKIADDIINSITANW
ncbi:MAG: hypothetical protein K9N46_16640 [Candidatus Marinimicrobia bacterium]|nr:hypothetical protein [Candidatus Neomarinimicrobiota bacterium]MCF7830055.1 hypothetical protein [Candidatus Neomarinimicrobiota bacterium]MCF7882356.1 hypothetical protein [Candidatus Neomarinimicrobiota bacterium]